MERTSSGKKGLAKFGMITPIVSECPVRKAAAILLRRYPSSWAAVSTRATILGLTRLLLFRTYETLAIDTPALLATSRIVIDIVRPPYLQASYIFKVPMPGSFIVHESAEYQFPEPFTV